MPPTPDNGRRSPKKLLRSVVARWFGQSEFRRRLNALVSLIPGLSEQQREEAKEFVEVGEYALAWEFLADWLIENEARISSGDYMELRALGKRIQLLEKPGIERLDDYLAQLGDLTGRS